MSCYKFAVVSFPVSTGVSVFAKVTRQVIKVPVCGGAANKAATVALSAEADSDKLYRPCLLPALAGV